jgi:hypothetical protein
MSRGGFHGFTSDAPTFGADVDCIDPFFDLPMADRAATVELATSTQSRIPLCAVPDQFNEGADNGNRR